ncbi:hypothetical protein TKK_0004918 [Trichogramma kaykai]|uniref:Methenyltetrahydrofolate synthase domain-containing protein n=1 Tax=Trichogramma kaykai TaxID=54128 RepID=A0ABD2XIM0_9HYME
MSEEVKEVAVEKLITKQTFREKIWVHMAKEKLASPYRSLCNRIPCFLGSTDATKRLMELDEFKDAKLLMISPDKPQKSVILRSLLKEKEVLVPRPRLLSGLFLHVKNASGLPNEETKKAVTRHNIKQIETPVGYDAKDLKVDMVVLGSLCVNKSGCRIGDGEGFADLEYVILSKMKAVNEKTVVVTTVHDCQILDDLPNDLFGPHDVPVDIIVTPTQTIVVNPKSNKPTEIIWSMISKRRLESIPVLSEIKQNDEKDGNNLTLKEEDSDVESISQEKLRINQIISKLQPKVNRKKPIEDNILKENQKSKDVRRKPYPRKQKIQKVKDENEENNENINKNEIDKSPAPTKSKKPRQRTQVIRNANVEFSLKLSNIASTVRVRDLKSALHERGVKPSNITWRGQRGFCYLHFGKLRKRQSPDSKEQPEPVQVDSIVANLRELRIGETDAQQAVENSFIVVEPAEPVTRIEVTDVTAV